MRRPRRSTNRHQPLPAAPENVGWTAVLVAAQRGRESLSAHPLFRDPLAELLIEVGELSTSSSAPRIDVMRSGRLDAMTRLMGDYLALRTQFFDNALRSAAASGIGQVVSLAAGLDGRSYRMNELASATFFEIDRPEVFGYRDELARAGSLRRTCAVETITQDLAGEWPSMLRQRGFDPRSPTAWLVEGLTIYLSKEDNDAWLHRVTDLSAPGSRLLFEVLDHPTGATMDADVDVDRGFAVFLAALGSGPPKPPEPWVASRGWQPAATSLVDLAAQNQRTLTRWFDPRRGGMRAWLLDCHR